jgi:hypothetical protein
MEEITFASYLKSKKIDLKSFYSSDKELFELWKVEFDQMHPNSFTQQKLFSINKVRRMYPLQEQEKVVEKKKQMVRPKIAKPKTS